VKEFLPVESIEKLEEKYKELNLKFRKYKIKSKKFSTKNTLEQVIKDWLDTEHLDEILDIINVGTNIDLRGYWYLSWNYYDNNIKDKEKVIIKRKY
jgi:arginyl-tRNA synthetase